MKNKNDKQKNTKQWKQSWTKIEHKEETDGIRQLSWAHQ